MRPEHCQAMRVLSLTTPIGFGSKASRRWGAPGQRHPLGSIAPQPASPAFRLRIIHDAV